LTDIALGMMPSKVWTGELDATGGYLIVKDNGEILYYHIYNRNEFEDYLVVNTKLETASSTRHDFGTIYSDGNELLFKLNLQIRFIK
jgi:type II restriction enzyme